MIRNGKNLPLNEVTGTLPDVSGAMCDWFQPITFTQIVKQVIDHKVQETETEISFKGVMQPMRPQEIAYRPEGDRAFKWHTCHTEIGTEFKVDDVILYKGVRYRVKSKANFASYGYLKYDLVEDYND